jgi:hypothetical protein
VHVPILTIDAVILLSTAVQAADLCDLREGSYEDRFPTPAIVSKHLCLLVPGSSLASGAPRIQEP